MSAIGPDMLGIQNSMIRGGILPGRNFPSQQPSERNAIVIHVGHESRVISAVPENVLVCIDDLHHMRSVMAYLMALGVTTRA